MDQIRECQSFPLTRIMYKQRINSHWHASCTSKVPDKELQGQEVSGCGWDCKVVGEDTRSLWRKGESVEIRGSRTLALVKILERSAVDPNNQFVGWLPDPKVNNIPLQPAYSNALIYQSHCNVSMPTTQNPARHSVVYDYGGEDFTVRFRVLRMLCLKPQKQGFMV